VDRGATWRAVGFTLEVADGNTSLASSGDQFMATGSSTQVYYSAKTGIGLDVLT